MRHLSRTEKKRGLPTARTIMALYTPRYFREGRSVRVPPRSKFHRSPVHFSFPLEFPTRVASLGTSPPPPPPPGRALGETRTAAQLLRYSRVNSRDKLESRRPPSRARHYVSSRCGDGFRSFFSLPPFVPHFFFPSSLLAFVSSHRRTAMHITPARAFPLSLFRRFCVPVFVRRARPTRSPFANSSRE